MRNFNKGLVLALFALSLSVRGLAEAPGVSPTAAVLYKAGKIQVSSRDLTVSDKKDYLALLVDLYPNKADLGPKPSKAALDAVAQAMADGPAAAFKPKRPKLKVIIVEYGERDEYGAPKLETAVLLATYEGAATRKSFKMERTK